MFSQHWDSVPSSTVGWWRGEERVVDQDGVHLHVGVRVGSRVNHSLLLSPVDSPVWGEYSCRASNGLGEAEASTGVSGRTEEATVRLDAVSGSLSSQQVDMEVESQAVVHGFLLLYRTGNTTSQVSSIQYPLTLLTTGHNRPQCPRLMVETGGGGDRSPCRDSCLTLSTGSGGKSG